MLRSPIQKSRHALPTWEALCSLARPRISPELSPKTPRNGARTFARRRSSRSEERSCMIRIFAILSAIGFALAPQGARAEATALRVAKQFGIAYLQFMVMYDQKLIEKE